MPRTDSIKSTFAIDASSNDMVDQIVHQLRTQIANGLIKPGARIIEAKLARELNISRAPIREAARKLESEGVLTSIHGRGFFVRHFTLRELQEILVVRLLIECEAARYAARNASPELCATLDGAVDRLVSAAESGSLSDRINADLEFHIQVVAASENRLLQQIFSGIAVETKMLLQLFRDTSINEIQMAESHRFVIQAIASRDEDRAAAAMAEHIRMSWDDMIAKARKTSDSVALHASFDT